MYEEKILTAHGVHSIKELINYFKKNYPKGFTAYDLNRDTIFRDNYLKRLGHGWGSGEIVKRLLQLEYLKVVRKLKRGRFGYNIYQIEGGRNSSKS